MNKETQSTSPEQQEPRGFMAKIEKTFRDKLGDIAHLVRVIRTGSRYPELNEVAKSLHQLDAFGRIDRELEAGQITAEEAELKKQDWLQRH